MKRAVTDRYRIKDGDLVIRPLAPERVKEILATQVFSDYSDQRLQEATALFEQHDRAYFFDTIWEACVTDKLKSTYAVGYAYFDRTNRNGLVKIHFFVKKECRNHGYAARMIRSLNEWAFSQSGIFEVEAYVMDDNTAATKAMTRAGMVYRFREHHEERYSTTKAPAAWKGLYMIIGVWIGLALGILLSNPTVGFVSGLIIGLAAGTGMETWEKKRREVYLAKNE